MAHAGSIDDDENLLLKGVFPASGVKLRNSVTGQDIFARDFGDLEQGMVYYTPKAHKLERFSDSQAILNDMKFIDIVRNPHDLFGGEVGVMDGSLSPRAASSERKSHRQSMSFHVEDLRDVLGDASHSQGFQLSSQIRPTCSPSLDSTLFIDDEIDNDLQHNDLLVIRSPSVAHNPQRANPDPLQVASVAQTTVVSDDRTELYTGNSTGSYSPANSEDSLLDEIIQLGEKPALEPKRPAVLVTQLSSPQLFPQTSAQEPIAQPKSAFSVVSPRNAVSNVPPAPPSGALSAPIEPIVDSTHPLHNISALSPATNESPLAQPSVSGSPLIPRLAQVPLHHAASSPSLSPRTPRRLAAMYRSPEEAAVFAPRAKIMRTPTLDDEELEPPPPLPTEVFVPPRDPSAKQKSVSTKASKSKKSIGTSTPRDANHPKSKHEGSGVLSPGRAKSPILDDIDYEPRLFNPYSEQEPNTARRGRQTTATTETKRKASQKNVAATPANSRKPSLPAQDSSNPSPKGESVQTRRSGRVSVSSAAVDAQKERSSAPMAFSTSSPHPSHCENSLLASPASSPFVESGVPSVPPPPFRRFKLHDWRAEYYANRKPLGSGLENPNAAKGGAESLTPMGSPSVSTAADVIVYWQLADSSVLAACQSAVAVEVFFYTSATQKDALFVYQGWMRNCTLAVTVAAEHQFLIEGRLWLEVRSASDGVAVVRHVQVAPGVKHVLYAPSAVSVAELLATSAASPHQEIAKKLDVSTQSETLETRKTCCCLM